MDAQILTVHWHDGEQPVYSAHFQPSGTHTKESERLATGGGDNNVRLWKIVRNGSDVKVEYLSTLAKHTQAVNAVRFDPTGTMLATAGDDGCAMIWTKADGIVREFGADADDEALESWTMNVMCRSSASEVYDLAWSPDSKHIITGSTDNVARVYDVSNGQQVAQITDHGHYVQGVAWDPLGKLLATQSADRSVHVYQMKNSDKAIHPTVLQKSSRAEVPTRTTTDELDYTNTKSSMIYHTESLRSFFRRLTFSTDGQFLLTPAGVFKTSSEEKDEWLNTVYIYTRQGMNKGPIAHLPKFKKPALIVSFSPVFYELQGEGNVFKLPYKMVYAVATMDSVYIFDTQGTEALGSVSSIHYGTLTDLCWNSDGQSLLVSSADGFCTSLRFDSDAFGKPLSVDHKELLSGHDGFKTDVEFGTRGSSVRKRPVETPASSPMGEPMKMMKSSPVAAQDEVKKPEPAINLISHLIKKKAKLPAAPVAIAKPDVIMLDADEQPAKEKKRISPTLITSVSKDPTSTQ